MTDIEESNWTVNMADDIIDNLTFFQIEEMHLQEFINLRNIKKSKTAHVPYFGMTMPHPPK